MNFHIYSCKAVTLTEKREKLIYKLLDCFFGPNAGQNLHVIKTDIQNKGKNTNLALHSSGETVFSSSDCIRRVKVGADPKDRQPIYIRINSPQ